MVSWEHYLPLIAVVVSAFVIVPLIGGACLLLTSRLAKISSATFLKCYAAYLTAYLAATVVCLPITYLAATKADIPDYVLWPSFFVLGFGVHMAVIPQFLKMPFWKSLLVHGSAVFLVGLVLVAMLWFPIQHVRHQARIAVAINNLHQIGIGMTYHMDQKETFPPAASYSKNGRPLLSWRVHLLPFLEQQSLYEQFHLDEPWDSVHNKTLLSMMPAVYTSPRKAPDGQTYFQVFVQRVAVSPKTNVQTLNLFGQYEAPFFLLDSEESSPSLPEYVRQRAEQGLKFHQITDGTARTFCVVEGKTSVPWTKPEDISYSPEQPLPVLGGLLHDGFLAVLFDSSVRHVGSDEKESVIRASITADGREEIDFSSR